MAQRTTSKKAAHASARDASRASTTKGFTDEERAAMRERVQELKTARNRSARGVKEDPERAVLAKIASFPGSDRVIGGRIHALVTAAAPALTPRLWYGMPAYAKDGQVVCFFQNASKFKTRYATLGFSDEAKLDDGRMWPTVYAVNELTAAEEARIIELVKRAVA